MTNSPKHIPAGTADAFFFHEHRFSMLATGEDTGGTYSEMEIVSPENSGPGPHVHADSEEHFLLLEGEVAFTVGDQTYLVKPGDFVHVPRGATHQFKVLAPHARMVATYTPAGEEQFFIEESTPRPSED